MRNRSSHLSPAGLGHGRRIGSEDVGRDSETISNLWRAGALDRSARAGHGRAAAGRAHRHLPLLPEAGEVADRHDADRFAHRLGHRACHVRLPRLAGRPHGRLEPGELRLRQSLAARLHGRRAARRAAVLHHLVAGARQPLDHAEPVEPRPLAELPLCAAPEPRLLPERLCRPHQPEGDADRHGASRERRERHRRRLVSARLSRRHDRAASSASTGG